MAVLGRLLVSSAERLDLPDFLSIDSYTQGDFKFLLKSFVGDSKPFILKGFDVINPGNAIGTQNISVRVADSVVYYPGSLAGPFFFGLEEGNTQAAPLVPELRKNATNYVYLTLTTTEAAQDTRAFWDPDKEGGAGGEFTQDVNTQTVLSVDINVSVSSFPENTIPVCQVVVGPNFIESISDARDMMFRLGSGGLNPNPLSRYDWRDEPSDTYERTEPNFTMSNALDPNPFQGGDKNIETLKEWMDAVMTKLAELGGTTYWYEDTSVYNLINVFKDALATSIKSKGFWNSSDVTPGLLTWSEDLVVQSASDLSEIIIRDGSKSLADNEVMYVDRVRDIAFNTGSIAVNWFNATNYVNGQLGAFENLSKGDWVKKADDSDDLYLRVEEFYAGSALAGGVTAPGNALSIKLSDTYTGLSESKQGEYIKGVYLDSDVKVQSRNNSEIQQAAGNFYWLAMRSDTVLNVSDITTTTLTCDITAHDGSQALVTSTGHGLSDGQRIQFSGTTNFDGVYAVSVETTDTFYITVSGGPHADELGQSATYATVTTAARSTDDGLELESANHGLSTDQRVVLSDTTNFNGDYQVYPTGATSFTIPFATAAVSESAGTTTIVNIYVRTDIGPTLLERGENKSVGEVDTNNILSFIGMDNDAQTHPNYYINPSYNTLDAQENYNSDATDNLTHRASKLTAMMADKTQDKTIKTSLLGVRRITNVENGINRDVTFVQRDFAVPMTITLAQPSSVGNCTITIDSTISLGVNQAAYVSIDRNAGTTLTTSSDITVSDIASVPLNENVFVLLFRLAGDEVHLWDGKETNDFQNALGNVQEEITTITLPAASSITSGQYFTINSASDATEYYVWFNKDAAGGNPAPAGLIGLEVAVTTGDTNLQVAAATQAVLDALVDFVTVDNLDGTITNTNSVVGECVDAANVDVGGAFAITVDQQGVGEVLHYISDGDLDLTALKKLDEQVHANAVASGSLNNLIKQNVSLKLVEGGTWSLVGNDLTSSASSFVQIPGLENAVNEIAAQTITLPNANSVAYVEVKRVAGATTLSVTVADIDSITTTDNTLIIARRVAEGVIIGTGSDLIKNGEFLELEGQLAEINRYHGQLTLTPTIPVRDKRVHISGSEILKLSGSKLTLEQKNLLLDFPGAIINFETGEIFETDGVTPFNAGLNDFTPNATPATEYFYYSVSILPNTVNADNTITGQILVIAANNSDAVEASAPKAPFPSSGIKLGNILTQGRLGGIEDIDYANILSLGVGGSGSGGTGDANELLERLKNHLDNGEYEAVTPNIFISNEEDLLDETPTTASFDIVTGTMKFSGASEVVQSIQMLDSTFLSENKDVSSAKLVTYWTLDTIDTAAVYELSRDGGNNWQTVTMDRIGGSDTYEGRHVFTEEPTYNEVLENAVANADSTLVFNDTVLGRSQIFTVSDFTVMKKLVAYLNVTGTIQGGLTARIVKDDSGSPSTDANDIVFQANPVDLSTLSAGDNAVDITLSANLEAGDYHIVWLTDLEYRSNWSSGVNELALRTDASAPSVPVSRSFDGSTWSAETEAAVYRLEGRQLDLRVRITSSAGDVFLAGYGVFYDQDDTFAFADVGYRRQVIEISGDDNVTSFDITEFTPDPILMTVYELETGASFRAGAFSISGGTVEFPANTFNKPGETITLEFLQVYSGSLQFDSTNRALLAANNLGSLDPSLDLSQPGLGVILRRPDGTLRMLTIDDDDNIDIKSLP